MATETTNIILRTWEDWTAFNRLFIRKAIDHDIWDQIDPDQRESPAVRPPERPQLSEFPRKMMQLTHAQKIAKDLATGLIQPAGSQAAEAEPIDEYDWYADNLDENQRARRVEDLSAASLTLYTGRWYQYVMEEEAYAKIRTARIAAHTALRDWVADHVDVSFHFLLLPGYTLRQEYAALKDTFDMTARKSQAKAHVATAAESQAKAYLAYTRFMATMPGTDLKQWFDQWLRVMAKGQGEQVPNTLQSNLWFNELNMKIREPDWLVKFLSSYRIINQADIKANAVDCVRFHWEVVCMYHEEQAVITDSEEPYNEEKDEERRSDGKRASDGKGGRTNRGDAHHARRRSRGGGSSGSKRANDRKRTISEANNYLCAGCLTPGHGLEECWTVFPDNAPSFWRPSSKSLTVFKARMESDESLRDEIEHLRRSKRR